MEKTMDVTPLVQEFRERPYLFTRAADGVWMFNRSGTVMTPVWDRLWPHQHRQIEAAINSPS